MRDWSSLLPDLVRRVADCILVTSDLDHYMDMRAVCHNWRSALVDPCSDCAGVDHPCFRPRHWVMLDEEVEPTDGVPVLLDHILVGSSDGLLIVGERKPHHALRILYPFTGSLLHFTVILPSYRVNVVVAVGHEIPTSLVFGLGCYDFDDPVWSADPTSKHARITYAPRSVGLASMVAHAGHAYIYMVDWEASVYEIVWDDCFTYRHWMTQRPDKFVSSEGSEPWEWPTNFLVESDGDLLLVRRPRLRWQVMEVFRVDVEGHALEPVNKIAGGRHALFLGKRCLSVDDRWLPSVDGNCIYYGIGDIYTEDRDLQKCEGMYRYDLGDGSEERISDLLSPHTESYRARPFSLVQVLITYCAVLPDMKAQVTKGLKDGK
ncbi:hypothetical protein ZWY2020_026420 [Hordeum vulgare]|nr:hypothetical protein ZWY2020_026420 [Hordeum vulgare]